MDEEELAASYLANTTGRPASVDLANATPGLSIDIRCAHCGLTYAEMPVGHTWRTDGSECWDEPEDADD